jgi:uncharacterized protein (UPF0332 family)
MLDLSQTFADEADHLIAGGYCRGAVSRLYLAMHHMVGALLVTEGFEARDHDAAAILLNLYFVRTGKLPESSARLYGRLMQLGHEADRLPGSSFRPEEVSALRSEVETFLETVRSQLRSEGWLGPGGLRIL